MPFGTRRRGRAGPSKGRKAAPTEVGKQVPHAVRTMRLKKALFSKPHQSPRSFYPLILAVISADGDLPGLSPFSKFF